MATVGSAIVCNKLSWRSSAIRDRLRVLGALRNSAALKAYSVVNWPYRLLFFGHQSVIRKITHKAVINNVKQCISNNLTLFFVCCNIHFQKYPMFLEKLFKYNRNNERSGCELNLQCRINKVTTCHGSD